MDIFKAWEEIIGDNPIVDDDGRQEELAEIAIDMVMEHPKSVVLDGVTYLVHDGSREVAYLIAAATGGQEPDEKGRFYTAMTQVCAPGFAMKFNQDEDDYPEIISPDEVKAILGGAGQDA